MIILNIYVNYLKFNKIKVCCFAKTSKVAFSRKKGEGGLTPSRLGKEMLVNSSKVARDSKMQRERMKMKWKE